MAKRRSWNPIAFVPIQVTLISSAVYLALFTLLIWVHETVPSAPTTATPVKGVNLTQTWLDLSFISDGYHPFNSRRNGIVRDYLIERVEEILEGNGVGFKRVETRGAEVEGFVKKGKDKKGKGGDEERDDPQAVTLFVDRQSNISYVDDFRNLAWTGYIEAENIMVYVRGTNDPDGDWWNDDGPYLGSSGVLVNAHYDSVSTGYGATDDGVGVVTVLQLISHFTTEGNQPRRGIVALLNNGEEDGLYGAHAYLRHPLSQLTHTFLNLEGAGAGGRATLFRSTDAAVTQFYAKSPYPYGSVVSADGFKRGFVRSGTDYSVFHNGNNMRGLDVAFFHPRARYHTDQDGARDTSAASVWNMLSAALTTVKSMTEYEGNDFEGPVNDVGKLNIDKGVDVVYFDLFARVLAVMDLHTLFGITVALAAAGPIILIVLEVVLRRSDKWYPLSKRQYLRSSDDDDAVHFSGLRGLFRFPIAFVASTAAVLALAYLLAKINPYIVYSSEYAVWLMMISAWFSVAWFLLGGADRIRPTALQRMYCLIWLYSLSWLALVGAAIGENNLRVGSGYLMVIYNGSVFVSLLISYFELFALPTKTAYVEHVATAEEEAERQSLRPGSSRQPGGSRGRSRQGDEEEEEPTESTSLLRGGDRRSGNTFTGVNKRRHPEDDGTPSESHDPYLTKAYGDEQAWSSSLPQFTWIVQFLLVAPINIIIIGQISLLITVSTNQTLSDGNAPLPLYLIIAGLTILLLLPLTPFLHRFTYQIPSFLFLVFIGCLIYNLLAFPFSTTAPLKVYPLQQVNLDSGSNNMTLSSLDGYVQYVAEQLPSAIGQNLHCSPDPSGRTNCRYTGLEPNVMLGYNDSAPFATVKSPYKHYLEYNITTHSENGATITVRGQNTRVVHIHFDSPISSVHIEGAAPDDPRFPTIGPEGTTRVSLFGNSWEKVFRVNVTWDGAAKGQTGRVATYWSDANRLGTVPAFDELRRFMPVWSLATKWMDGLVEGWREWEI